MSVAYTLIVLSVVALTVIFSNDNIINHLQENLISYHKYDAFDKFWYVPQSPYFTFFRIGAVLEPFVFAAFASLFALRVFVKQNSNLRPVTTALICFVVAHALLIDALPFTKLSRSHFAVYPLVILAVALMADDCVRKWYRSRVLRRFCLIGLLLCGTGSVAMGFQSWGHLVAAKQVSAQGIVDLAGGGPVVMLADDPFREFVSWWLRRDVLALPLGDIVHTIEAGGVFILGPHGEGSGNTVLLHCSLADFYAPNIDSIAGRDTKSYQFPYYAYTPHFSFEEEICQALYFEGKIPHVSDKNKLLTVIANK
ncbi:MAG: hypothetical protein P1P84_07155 [Deferrisomatales bacterium]|nr:hypothetical protein [Deferrisomatales bacterium]